ncbi:MAG TPA: tripartite tricarboxylate transporter substrate binding protein [Burkholderiales bacterium]|nr:tripartite tricarboxylate transporter substrate binding protein [Burkholderiales bacterium]
MSTPFLEKRTGPMGLLAIVLALLLVSHSGFIAAQQKYPTKPVRIIYPSATGSTGEVRTRVLADKLSQRLGQRFIVESKPGASTTIGTALVAAAPPDGYTLLSTFTPAFPIGPQLYKTAGYDPVASFTPIGMFSRGSPFLIVSPSLPAKTLNEFVALAKAKPGAITVAHGGVGVANHLPAVLFFRAAGIQVLFVPYKGESAALPDLMSGQVDALFSYTAVAVPQIKAGKVRALAFAGFERNHAVPEIPTFPEAGFPGFHFDATMLLLGPAGLPREIVALLNREIASILQEPDVRATYESTGSNPVLGSPEDLGALIKREVEINGGLVKELGMVLE